MILEQKAIGGLPLAIRRQLEVDDLPCHDDLLPVVLLRVCEQLGDFQQICRDTSRRQDDKKQRESEKEYTPKLHDGLIIPSFCRNSREQWRKIPKHSSRQNRFRNEVKPRENR